MAFAFGGEWRTATRFARMHKIGLAEKTALRLPFRSLTYRTYGSHRALFLPNAKATRKGWPLHLVESGGLEPSTFRV